MSKTITLLLLFIAFAARAQQTAIGLPQLNVLYIGVDNPVTIAVEGYASKNVVKEFLQGDIIEKDSKTYLRVYARGEATLKVGVKKGRDKIKWLEEFKFRVRKLPVALPQLGTLQDGSVADKATIKANAQRLFLSMGEGFMMAGVLNQAISFDVTVIDSVSVKMFANTGPVLSAEVKDAIGHLCEGGKIIINNVRYRLIKWGDTLNYEEPLAGDCEISVRSYMNTYTVEGGFTDTQAIFYDSYWGNGYKWAALINRKRHGRWVYKTGICSPRIYQEEWYDSGKLVKYKWYDSTGFAVVSLDIPAHTERIYYKELFRNGKVKRAGTIVAHHTNFRYVCVRKGDYCGPESLHPFQDVFKTFRFTPYGDWKEYYPTGQIRYTGSFTVDFPGHGDSMATVRPAGVWNEYDKAGKSIAQYNFDGFR